MKTNSLLKKLAYTLIFDTQGIEYKDQGSIDLEVIDFLKNYSKVCNIRIVLPAIVREEIRKHFYIKVSNQCRSYNALVKDLKSSTGRQLDRFVLTKEEIIKICDDQLSPFKITIVEPNYNSLPWSSIINNAVWKVPPFEEKREKGFKDKIVLESLKMYLETSSKERVVFICNDKKILEAINLSFSDGLKANLILKESIRDFDSVLKLELEELNKSQILIISQNALETFTKYLVNTIKDRIKEKYYYIIDSAPETENSNVRSFLNHYSFEDNSRQLYSNSSTSPLNDGTFNMTSPIFVSKSSNLYTWETRVVYEREFSDNFGMYPNKLVKSEFSVIWESRVSKSGTFSKQRVENIKFLKQDIEVKSIVYNTRLFDNSLYKYALAESGVSTGGQTLYPMSGISCTNCGKDIPPNQLIGSEGLCSNCLWKRHKASLDIIMGD
jgi:hypothetical protein